MQEEEEEVEEVQLSIGDSSVLYHEFERFTSYHLSSGQLRNL